MAEDKLKIGLALSGGGFRATLFHLGALRRLNELGWLRKLDIITSVSGGAIIAGVLARHWNELSWGPDPKDPSRIVAANFSSLIEPPIRDFCGRHIDVLTGLAGLIDHDSSFGERIAAAYDKHLFDHWTLQQLPPFEAGKSPRFVFYATSFQTGNSVRISPKYLADYRIGRIDAPNFSLAMTVAASSAFPPLLSPVVFNIEDPSVWREVPGADQYRNAALKQQLILGDGGIYDNLGLEAVWRRCETVLVSDGGAPMDVESSPWTNPVSQMNRVRDILINQTRALRKRQLIDEFQKQLRAGAYWGVTTQIANYQLADAIAHDSERTAAQQHARTRLDRFNDREQGELINWGYALADAGMRAHVMTGTPVGAWHWPDTDYKFP